MNLIMTLIEFEAMDYYGFNYRIVLGIMYASIFPDDVVTVILDDIVQLNVCSMLSN